ncbi:sperm flagellar protein 2 isoform X3 [Alosa alosa]|uniref:sperm flagellar protein 2 isoform X3 n=1 Tax=Alosa alosa TaxID=278164 RepID=UPI0020155282|nr:sperm flagellar protein 2 isoform X3 [Alosa alosa]
MSDILCRWLNSELRLSKVVEQSTISKDFSNGYLIGEVLHKYELQNDFDQFSKSSSSNAKLNNFTRMEPTLHLLGVPFDLALAKAVMQGQPGAATRLLYQLFILLQNKKKAGLTGTAMETMQPAATARLHRVENDIYTERLKMVVKREAEIKMQLISQRFEMKAQDMYNKSVMADLVEDQKRRQEQEQLRLQDIEKLRLTRKKQQEIMSRILTASIQIPKPPPNRTLKALERQRHQRKQVEAKNVHLEIAQFEKSIKRLCPPGLSDGEVAFDCSTDTAQVLHHTLSPDEMIKANSEYIQKIRQRLEEDTAAREQREKRRRRVLVEQLRAHEAQEEALREEQLVERLMRQSQQEKRLAVQLMQMRQQKEVLRQNRILRERQHQEQRQRDFQEALDREAALARQARLEQTEEAQKEIELHDRIAADRAQVRYRKHYDFCKEVLEQVVDLATKAGEYRLFTANLIPAKMMREWKELFFSGKPLYEQACVDPAPAEPTPEQLIELEKEALLNRQDYDEYVSMTGDWAWPEEGDPKSPPSNNDILGHIVHRLQNIVNPPKPGTPPPLFPCFLLKACVLGKVLSGKTTCLSKIAQVHGIHVLSATVLIQEALAAFQAGETEVVEKKECEAVEGIDSPNKDADESERESEKEEALTSHEAATPGEDPKQKGTPEKEVTPQLSMRAQHGAAVEKVLREGQAVPNELLVDIIVDAIRHVPAGCGWILDGFPVDVAQAKLLEKALSGSDPDKPSGKSSKASLAVDKNVPQEAPPSSKALDLVILMEVADDVVLDRAAKQAIKEQSPAQVKDDDQKPEGEVPTTQDDTTEQAVRSSSKLNLKGKQLQHWITGFQDTWPKLEEWFSGKQNVLVKVNAQADEVTVFKKVEQIIQDTIISTEKAEIAAQSESVSSVAGPPLSTTTPAASSSALAQEGLTTQRPRSKSITQSPRASHSQIEGLKEKKSTHSIEGKDSRRQLSGKLSGSGLAPVRRLSVSSSFEHALGESSSPDSAVPGSDDWVYVDEPLPKEVSEYLVPYWDNVCDSYVTNVKAVMQNLRRERNLIIHHLHSVRDDFKQYLKRPDLKQEFVCQWQQDFNTIPDDMREDEETQAELHQRLDDLRERLWDICDRKKEEAEQERAALTEDGWLEDHAALLHNHFYSLMQVEVDRFQDTLRLLRDYYYSMRGTVLPEVPADFTCIPLLDIVEDEEGNAGEKSKSSPPGSVTPDRASKSGGKKDSDGPEEKKTKIVPLIARRPLTADSAKQRGSSQADEKLVNDTYQAALTAVNNLMQAELQQQEVEESRDKQVLERERQLRMSQASAPATSAKDKKKGGGGGGGGGGGAAKKKDSSPTQEPSPPPVLDLQEARKVAIRTKIRQEYLAALEHEDCAVKQRLKLIKRQAVETIQSLQTRADHTFRTLEDWLGARFLAEMGSIDQLAEVARHHIESATKVPHELMLVCTDFFVDGDLRVLPSPSPPPRPPAQEVPVDTTLTILQLQAFHSQLLKVAPSGMLSSNEFSEILKELTLMNMGDNDLPDTWMNISESQILDLVTVLSQDSEMLDWRLFLLSAALPWPMPTKQLLLQVLNRFRAADPQHTGFITEDQYLQIELWFTNDDTLAIPDDPSEPLPYDRLANLKKFFFTLFAEPDSPAARLDYMDMLLYLAAHRDAVQGFVRALSLVTGQPLHYQSNTSPLLKSVLYMGEEAEEVAEAEEEESPEGADGEGVTISALLHVVCHRDSKTSCHNPFQPNLSSKEEYKEELMKIYKDLGFGPEEKAPFSLLSQVPWIQNLMESTLQYQLPDVHRILYAPQSRREPLGFSMS